MKNLSQYVMNNFANRPINGWIIADMILDPLILRYLVVNYHSVPLILLFTFAYAFGIASFFSRLFLKTHA
ncbi:hypothetical protein AHIS1_p008 [Acaryochloris phage A-HIS1]|nr:hypothetical protein AHIS1_p008 [Acaryochloris phage A-HIS1]